MKILCIYHGKCMDGFTAAWVVQKALGRDNVEFFPGVYQDPPPDVTGRKVVMVDFSYKRPVILNMIEKAERLCILDHHKTAETELAGLDGIRDGVEIQFDMKRSGAGMAWDWFFPHEKRPRLIDFVEDRDLGGGIAFPAKFQKTRAVNTVMFSHVYDFDKWDDLAALIESGDQGMTVIETEAEAIDRKHFKDIRELLEVTKRRMVIGGYDVPVASLPYTMTSDAGQIMSEGEPFAACYWDTPAGRVFSLRSREDGLDVSQIAKQYSGGGHARAAGFRMHAGWEGDAIGTDQWERGVEAKPWPPRNDPALHELAGVMKAAPRF